MSFSTLLRRYRLRAGLTQTALAERAGLSREVVSSLERGERHRPRAQTLHLLVDALGIVGADEAALRAAVAAAEDGATAREKRPPPPLAVPAPTTPLLGRAEELVAAVDLVLARGCRLLTIAGPGGVGKTRFVVELASKCALRFADGATVVSLASLQSPELLTDTLVHAVGVGAGAGGRPFDALAAHLRQRHMLLVLDNFEHLLAGASVVSDLLTLCPRLSTLVTSRSILHVQPEYVFQLPPLELPTATELFVARARAVRPDFELDADNAADVAAICRRLDGLPLAIELAAARIRRLSPHALLLRLERRLPTLIGGARDLPDRHRTLRSALAWSYALLSSPERRLLRRLSVFSGGASLEAVEAVCAVDPPGPLSTQLDLLAALIDHALLLQPNSSAGDPRVDMLETIREFAYEQLADSGELEDAQDRHARFFHGLAEQSESGLRDASQQATLARLRLEYDNIRGALRWAQDSGQVDLGMRLASACLDFWWMRGDSREARVWLEGLLARASTAGGVSVSTSARIKALNALAWAARLQTDEDSATRAAQEALALSRQTGDSFGVAYALTTLAMVAVNQKDYATATRLQEDALGLYREMDNTWAIAACLNNLGLVAGAQGDFAHAAALLEESLRLSRARGDWRSVGFALANLAGFEYAQGHSAPAAELWRECLRVYQPLGVLHEEVSFQAIEGLGGIAAEHGQPERAARLLAAAEALRDTAGSPRPPSAQPTYESAGALAHAQLDPRAYERETAKGTRFTMPQAIAEALAAGA
jgi:predicted ATPase/transcriptional regulator with XRE-family HTH domain